MSPTAPIADRTADVRKTTCYMCACRCGIRVHLQNGEIRYIDGNPEHPLNQGVICAKGSAGIMKQYSPARLTRPLLRKAGGGSVVLMSSAAGRFGYPLRSPYAASKWASVGLAETLAMELGPDKIRVNAICPGFVRTPLAEAQVRPLAERFGVSEEVALKQHLLAKQPSRRWVEVEEVAQMALWLVGPGSGAVNGAALSIDGGWMAA